MNLQQIREMFIEITGRYDFEDRPEFADFFINAGSRILDRKTGADFVRTAQHTMLLREEIDRYVVPNCWMVDAVDIIPVGTTQEARRLRKIANPGEFQRLFGIPRGRGNPSFYTIGITRNEPALKILEAVKQDVPSSLMTTSEYNTASTQLEFFPKPDRDYYLIVTGKFYARLLIEPEDDNVWSLNYPDTLVRAAAYVLEVSYRNTEGANDWMNALMTDLLDIEKVEIETILPEFPIMRG